VTGPRTIRLTVAAFGAIYLLWGGTYLAIAVGLESIPAFLLMASRSVLGGVVLLLLSAIRGFSVRPSKDWLHAAISGLFLFVGCHGALAYAEHFIPSGLAAVVLATIPFWIVLVNLAIGQQEPWRKLAGLFPGLLGVALIAWRGSSRSDQPLPPTMIALLLASALSWALGTVYSQRRAAHIRSHDLAGMQLICGGIGLFLLSAIAGEWQEFQFERVSMASVGAMLYLALLGSAVGNTAYLWLIDRMSATLVATYTFVNPVVALILGWWILNERITIASAVGAALVIGSVVFVQRLVSRRSI
jgi:drug/metabolite transporter (DMT)-like permease